MASFLRAIVAAVRSWFRSLGGRRARLEGARVAAEAEVRRKAEEEERARLAAEAEARRQAEEAARVAAEAKARRKAEVEEQARVVAEAEARRQVEEAARVAAETEARRKAEDEERARLAAEAEARWQAEEAARVAAETEARRKAEDEERARLAAEAEARRQAEEAARVAAEAEARHRAEEEERARLAAEAETRRQAEEGARVAAEAEAQRRAEEEEWARLAAEAEARRQVEEAARVAAEAEARHKAEEEARARDAGDANAGLWPEAEVAAHPAPAGEDAPLPKEEEKPAGEEAPDGEPAGKASPRTRAPRYRAPAGGAPPPRNPPTTGCPAVAGSNSEAGGRQALLIELRLLFDRGGCCGVSLLPRRTSGLPEELTLRTPTGTVDLIALQEDWYQDVAPHDLAALLRDGVVWRDDDTGQEWLLPGREVFVLAPATAETVNWSGLLSCARLVVGRDHAVVCTTLRLPAVEAVLRRAGCEGWTQLDENDGAPRGWVVLRGVRPRAPVHWEDSADILNVLRPLPQIEIALEGGICLGYASWLAGHPPSIRVYGDPDHSRDVRIDGQVALVTDDSCFTAPGWDALGAHQVWCNGITRTYTLVRSEPSSRAWAAFSFPAPGGRRGGRLAICGPLVRALIHPEADGDDAPTSDVLQIPAANPVLLGSLPGQVFVASPRPDLRGAQCLAPSPFTPTWALPAQPLLCSKRDNRVRLVDQLAEPGHCPASPDTPPSAADIDQWCRLIRDASRKGLAVEPATAAATELWTRYKKYARDLWRKRR